MPVLELELPFFITYSSYTIKCIVNNLPSGVSLVTGVALIKRLKIDDDPSAVVTKSITTVLTANGQITDDGASDTQGEAVFIFSGTDTAQADPARQLRYEVGIKFYLSSGGPLEFAQCFIKPIQGIVQATS